MAEALPLLIGLTGKRDLLGQEGPLRDGLEDIFRTLDHAFPFSPKVLVTGLAEGADMLATEMALVRPGWLVLGLLPLALDPFMVTLSDDTQRARLRGLLCHPKLTSRTLAALNLPPQEARDAEFGTGISDNAWHYEQLGLWLAEHATVLIAVRKRGEVAGKVGGTMRVVNHRLAEPPPSDDAVAAATTAASSELANRAVLDRATGRPVWLVELSSVAGSDRCLSHLVIQPRSDDDCRPREPVCAPPHGAVRDLFPHAKDIDQFNMRVGGQPGVAWPDPPPDATVSLERFRRTLSGIQGRFQTRWKRCIWTLAALFVIALGFLEAHAKLGDTNAFAHAINVKSWAMGAYVGLVAICIGLFIVARYRQWQTVHEDYRAANEVLRVQRAWWHAGLNSASDRADHVYLEGTSGSLARVRRGAGAVITWVRLCSAPASADWSAIHGNRRAYVEGQTDYFHQNARRRRKAQEAVEITSWMCFAVSLGIAAWLMLYANCTYGKPAVLCAGICSFTRQHVDGFPWLFAVLVIAVWSLLPFPRHHWLRTAIPACIAGCLIVAPMVYDLGYQWHVPDDAWRPGTRRSGADLAGAAMALVCAVTLLAIAGAIRFVAEKLAWEAEALAYQEAHHRFAHGLDRLQRLDASKLSEDEKRRRKQAVVRELGIKGLAENEAWLRAHRGRPIEPLLGG